MLKFLSWVAITIMALCSHQALALESYTTPVKTTVQTPCKVPGFTSLKACVVNDVYYQANAPRNDIFIKQLAPKAIIGKYPRIASINYFHILPKYYNQDSVISLWDDHNKFVAQWPAWAGKKVTIFYASTNGGIGWSLPRSLTNHVRFDITF